MPKEVARILLIEDDVSITSSLDGILTDEGFSLTISHTGEEGLMLARDNPYDLVITDLKLPGISGLELVQRLKDLQPRLPIILMTAHGTSETAIAATKSGAWDYLVKPFEIPDLLDLTRRAIAASTAAYEPVQPGALPQGRDVMIGNSRAMQMVYKEIGRVAATPVTVLVLGETGTGKEVVAKAICQHSSRADRPFIAVNCAAIPDTLLESELFGHERGAFTGADSRRIGRFEQADAGTLFLDEIGDMNLDTQAKLLRVLQEKCIQRLGGKETIPVDVRVIAATHHDLETSVREREFREDLYYRLNVALVRLPPLRERREDVADLVRYYLLKFSEEMGMQPPSIHPNAVLFLEQQQWPGNVRQLTNIIRKGLLGCSGLTITVEQLQQMLTSTSYAAQESEQSLAGLISGYVNGARAGELLNIHGMLIEHVEKELLGQAIRYSGGNQAKAARWLGLSRLTLRQKLKQYGLKAGEEN